MNDEQFDNLTRSLADGVSRRNMLKLIGGALVTGILTLVGVDLSREEPSVSAQTPDPLDHQVFLPIVVRPPCSAPKEITCPSCGACTQCEVDTVSNSFTCTNCLDCTTAALCDQANDEVNHQDLVCYLYEQGFKEDSTDSLILYEDGILNGKAVNTIFTHSNDSSQSAEIIYAVNTIGEALAVVHVYKDDLLDHSLFVNENGLIEIVVPSDISIGNIYQQARTIGISSDCRECEDNCDFVCNWVVGLNVCTKWGLIICFKVGATNPVLGLICGAVSGVACTGGAVGCTKFCKSKICCPEGLTCCDDGCVNLASDLKNCGKCGYDKCGDCEICSGGNCVSTCGSGETCCNGQCVSATSINANCGGVCCEEGQICCDGSCVGVDEGNCGGCGITCDGCSQCVDGGCVSSCEDGLACCGGVCQPKCGPCQECDPVNLGCVSLCDPFNEYCCNGTCLDISQVCP